MVFKPVFMGLEDGMPNPETWKAVEPENVTHESLWLKRKRNTVR